MYYPSSRAVYGDAVETMVQEEDSQPLSVPIVAPIKVRSFRAGAAGGPPRRYDDEYVASIRGSAEQQVPPGAGVAP